MLLYTPESVYALDQAAITQDGLSAIELMRRAGERVWDELILRWPQVARISIFAGSGNNGGDAFVVALCARRHGVAVQLLTQGDLQRQSETARHFARIWADAGGEAEAWAGQPIDGDVIVDGLLGIGLQRPLDENWQNLILAINASPVPRVAIDIPSGLNARTGIAQPVAVAAQLCVTFIAAKTGQYLADGPDYCGQLVLADLGVAERTRVSVEAALQVIENCVLPPPRKINSHKNHYGHVLIVGGDRGMSGAVALAALAALRSGAGLVTALVHPDCRMNLAQFPEVMVHDWDALESRLELASVVVVGPGLGESDAARQCLQRLRSTRLPLVIDAGALTAEFVAALQSGNAVITPHPGEAARLLATTTAEIQADRIAAIDRLVETFEITAVLKGSGTLVSAAGSARLINLRGNPGMATAGMGDVLSGMIAAFIGQGLEPCTAAATAVSIHARCADQYCLGVDPCGLIASDVIARIPRTIRQLRDAR